VFYNPTSSHSLIQYVLCDILKCAKLSNKTSINTWNNFADSHKQTTNITSNKGLYYNVKNDVNNHSWQKQYIDSGNNIGNYRILTRHAHLFTFTLSLFTIIQSYSLSSKLWCYYLFESFKIVSMFENRRIDHGRFKAMKNAISYIFILDLL